MMRQSLQALDHENKTVEGRQDSLPLIALELIQLTLEEEIFQVDGAPPIRAKSPPGDD